MTDYTDPSTIDTDTVCGEINHAFKVRGHMWTDRPSWPNVTVKALADRIAELEAAWDRYRHDIAELTAQVVQLTAERNLLDERYGLFLARAERAEAVLAQVRAKVPDFDDLTDDDDRWVADEAYNLLVDLDDILDGSEGEQ